MENLESSEKERFISEIEKLISNDRSLNYSIIAQSVGFKSQDFTDIKSGKKKVQRKFLDAIADRYGLDKMFILTGAKSPSVPERTNVEDIEDLKSEVESLAKENKLLKETVEVQRKYISVLEEKLSQDKRTAS